MVRQLQAEARSVFGKAVRKLRREGLVPAELYGHGLSNHHLVVKKDAFLKVFKVAGAHMVITLIVDGTEVPVVVHDTQRHYVSGEVAHIDFYQVRADEKITAKIPIEFVGVSPAAKEHGAFINRSLHEIEVEALPGDLPSKFTVDLSALTEVEMSIYVSELAMPAGVKLRLDPETVIATAVPAKGEEVVEAPAVDVSTVKVEGEEKKAAREQSGVNEEKK